MSRGRHAGRPATPIEGSWRAAPRRRGLGRRLSWVALSIGLGVVAAVTVQAVWPTRAAPPSIDARPSGGGGSPVTTPGAGGASGGTGSATAPGASEGRGAASSQPLAGSGGSPDGEATPGAAGGPPRWAAFSTSVGVRLYLPAPDPVAVTYHEASTDEAIAQTPFGHVLHNYNRYKFRSTGPTEGPGYIVMSSRGRSQPATSAADVVLEPGTPVRSPVTGRVVGVRRYELYCRYPDARVAIVPEGRPDLRVVLLHVSRVAVHPGDRVFATLSVIGRPRVFPFRSQVDDYIPGGRPHVHIEVEEPSPAPVPACPGRRR